MIARILSASYQGIEAYPVEVEVDVSLGLPKFTVVGLPDQAVKEAKERVRAAIKNSGYPFPARKITVNLAPADVKKEGPAFDLPIALGILAATEVIPRERLNDFIFLGELALDGSLRRIRGAIVVTSGLKKQSLPFILPETNAREASLEKDVSVFPVGHLCEVVSFLQQKANLEKYRAPAAETFFQTVHTVDFSEVRGQTWAKRAAEIAVAGHHNLLFLGPPGSGKTMLARRIPTLFPPLDYRAALEITKIYSIAGLLPAGVSLIQERPFRDPHSSTSQAALAGGGSWPKPGEISLAHQGVLFLDEFPEFHRDAIESLRSPLEEGEIRISRSKAQWTFPAAFMLVCAMNPCPCGWLGDRRRACQCSLGQIQKYRSKISGPLLDRIDLHVEVPALAQDFFLKEENCESSETIRKRVLRAREIQRERYSEKNYPANHYLTAKEMKRHCRLDAQGQQLMSLALKELGLTARAYYKILKISRTIADLAEEETIQEQHLSEAIQYRVLDRAGFTSAY